MDRQRQERRRGEMIGARMLDHYHKRGEQMECIYGALVVLFLLTVIMIMVKAAK